jgi:hypothetical protein
VKWSEAVFNDDVFMFLVSCDVKLAKVCLVSLIKAVFFYETLFQKVGGLNSMNLP